MSAKSNSFGIQKIACFDEVEEGTMSRELHA